MQLVNIFPKSIFFHIVSIYVYRTSHSTRQSEALPVRETQEKQNRVVLREWRVRPHCVCAFWSKFQETTLDKWQPKYL